MDPKEFNILVLGSGAIGSLYGGKLAQIGSKVYFFCRSDYEVVKERGIQVKSIWGDFSFKPHKTIRSCDEVDCDIDFILVCLKVLPEIDVPYLIRPAVGSKTSIVLIQNGIDIEPPIKKAFPDNELISVLAFVCSNRVEPGIVHHLDYGQLKIGTYPYGIGDGARTLKELFDIAKVPCELVEDVVKARWQKLVWNAPFNPLSVLSGGADTLQMLKDKNMRKLIYDVMKEVCCIAKAEGKELPENIPEEMIKLTEKMVPYKTSMLLDFEAKRPMEVEAILGNGVRIAKKHGLDVPKMETLYSILSMLDRKNRGVL